MSTHKAKYLDLFLLPEDDRIQMIGEKTMASLGIVGFVVDSDDGKAERYLLKLFVAFPNLELVDKSIGPVSNTVLCRVRKKQPIKKLQ